MASLDEAYESVIDNKEKTEKISNERTFKSLMEERSKHIEPFTQKQNESKGFTFLDKSIK